MPAAAAHDASMSPNEPGRGRTMERASSRSRSEDPASTAALRRRGAAGVQRTTRPRAQYTELQAAYQAAREVADRYEQGVDVDPGDIGAAIENLRRIRAATSRPARRSAAAASGMLAESLLLLFFLLLGAAVQLAGAAARCRLDRLLLDLLAGPRLRHVRHRRSRRGPRARSRRCDPRQLARWARRLCYARALFRASATSVGR